MAWTSFLGGRRRRRGRRKGGKVRFWEDNNVFVCVLGREKIGGRRKRVRQREKAIVVVMIPLGSEGWAEL